MEVAEKKGLPKLKYHLLPRTKGFCVTAQNLRGTGESFLAFSNDEPIANCFYGFFNALRLISLSMSFQFTFKWMKMYFWSM